MTREEVIRIIDNTTTHKNTQTDRKRSKPAAKSNVDDLMSYSEQNFAVFTKTAFVMTEPYNDDKKKQRYDLPSEYYGSWNYHLEFFHYLKFS